MIPAHSPASFKYPETLLVNEQAREAVVAMREPLAYVLRSAVDRICGVDEPDPWRCCDRLRAAGCFGGTLHRHLTRMLSEQRKVANGGRCRPRDASFIVPRAKQLAGKVARLLSEGGAA
ncbi:hypothetical protein Pla123a_30260 [Posidoniimonas polymericola]|uniref:Uncharacterized protein n=1 Tax=Posidoniimonas polymericola TaxID=2528002 RepID=A0A5C5YKZ3_9BACT|nr:hypothetical protein [Posidoniimonas polymericola]TWT75517.1 hypothetical protein Pla123a_30260 [Posidoniimonas polymericola]